MAGELIIFEQNGDIKASEMNSNFKVLQEDLTSRLLAFEEYLNNEVAKLQGNFVLPGAVIGIPSTNIPYGYLLCDGSSLLKEEYADLFEAIGDTYGSEDALHFNVPDFRGMFLRGAGGENSASLGIVQECAVPNITGKSGGLTLEGGSKTDGAIKTVRTGNNTVKTADGQKEHGYIEIDASLVSEVYKNDITEVRPINQSINWVIKY